MCLPGNGYEYVQLELAADQVLVYESKLVPGLLQTTEYATAVADVDPSYPEDDAHSALVAFKLAWQRAILKERQPEPAMVIEEAVLHCTVGSPEVMRAQLRRLAEAAEDIPRDTVQVLPFSSEVHAAGMAGQPRSCGCRTRQASASCTCPGWDGAVPAW